LSKWTRLVLALVVALTLGALAKPVPETILNLVDEGKLQQAEQQLRVEMEDLQGAERAPFSRFLADVLYRQGRLEEALTLHREVSLYHPDPVTVEFSMFQVGNISVMLGQHQSAEEAFRKLLAERPDSVAAVRATEGLADLAVQKGRLKEAVTLLDQAAGLWKLRGDKRGLADNLVQKAQVLLQLKDYKSALDNAEESILLERSVEGLVVRAQAHHFQLNFDDAVPCYAEALELADQSFGKTSEWSRTVRTGMGLALIGRQDYAEALEVFRAIPDEFYPDRPFYLSYLYEALDRPAEAVTHARIALDRLSSLPPGSEGQIRSFLVRGLLSLGRLTEAEQELVLLEQVQSAGEAFEVVLLRSRLYRLQGRYPEARRLLENLKPSEQPARQAGLAEAWALVYLGESRFEEAKPWLEKALLVSGEDTVAPWVFLRLAEVEFFAGQLENAKERLEMALSQVRTRYGGRHLLTASTLSDAADIYSTMGEGEEVDKSLRLSLDIYQNKLGEKSFEALLVETKLGIHEVAVGRPSGQSKLERALQHAPSLPSEQRGQIETLACLGMTQLAKDDSSATQWLERGLQYAEGPYKTVYLVGLASRILNSDPEKAKTYAQIVLTQSDLPIVQSSANLILAEAHRGEPDTAKEYYEKALALNSTSFFSLLARMSLATIYLNDRRPDLALPILREALVQEQRFSTTTAEGMNAGSLTVEALLSLGRKEDALTVADGTLARSLTRLIAKQTAGDLAGIPSQAKRRLDHIEFELLNIDKELRSSDPLQMGRRQRQAQLTAEQEQLFVEKKELLDELSSKYPGYSELLSPTPIDVPAVQSVLREDEAALLYYLGGRSFVFIVTREGMSFVELRTPVEEINALAESYNRSLGTGRFTRAKLLSVVEKTLPPKNTDEIHQALADAVLSPLKDHMGLIEGRSLVIVPTQNLWMIPFESLSGLKGEKFLVQERSISYAPSLSLFVRFRQLKQKQGVSAASPLVLGGANYGDQAAPLPYAKKEADSVAARWPDSFLYTGDQATEVAYLENAKRDTASLIHFATHGVLGESPALLLTASGGRDGRLDMSEILGQPISANLVTLSACSSGRGWVRPGEGVVGLSRAFMHAGASSVLVSLWNVNDRSTARLMELFYQGLEELGPSKALRQAQLKMIEEGATLNQWAPFVVVGAP
jgi:tetratricopeptide (TPR) repeat protein